MFPTLTRLTITPKENTIARTYNGIKFNKYFLNITFTLSIFFRIASPNIKLINTTNANAHIPSIDINTLAYLNSKIRNAI